jgi:hypothetical protein
MSLPGELLRLREKGLLCVRVGGGDCCGTAGLLLQMKFISQKS